MTISWSLQAPSSWRFPTRLLAEYSVSCLEWLLQWVYINIVYKYEICLSKLQIWDKKANNIQYFINRLGCRISSLLIWIQRETSLCSASQFSFPWWAFSSLRPLILSSFVPLPISTIPKVKASSSGVAPVDEEKPRTRHHHNSRDWSDIEGISLTYLLWY